MLVWSVKVFFNNRRAGYLVALFGDVGEIRPVNMVVRADKLGLFCELCRTRVNGGLRDIVMRGPTGQIKLGLDSYAVEQRAGLMSEWRSHSATTMVARG